MNAKTNKMQAAELPRFQNRAYRAKVSRTSAGSPILKLTAMNPKGLYASWRQLAAYVYELAAEMERRSEDLGADWVISADGRNGRIVIELASNHEAALADKFVARIMAAYHLA